LFFSKPKSLAQLVDTALSEEFPIHEPYRNDHFRASAFPVCPRRYVISNLVPSHLETVPFSYSAMTIMNMGTALHSSTQRYLGNFGILFGNYKCPTCGHITPDTLGPITHCNVASIYDEYNFIHPSGLTGHTDGILRVTNPEWLDEPINAVLEIKSSNDMKMKSMKKPVWYHHQYQATFYLKSFNLLMSERLGFEVTHILLMYVGRDLPSKRKFFLEEPDEEAYADLLANVKKAKKKLALKVLPERKLCTTPEDAKEVYCKWVDLCFLSDDKIMRKHEKYLKSLEREAQSSDKADKR
jgi:hypothetical protein